MGRDAADRWLTGVRFRWFDGHRGAPSLNLKRFVVLSVGQCGFDDSQIARWLNRLGTVEMRSAPTTSAALAALRDCPPDLVLVNRLLDGDGSSGLDLIQTIKSDPASRSIPVMLVSNLANAQERAREFGALPGFGKADLRSEAVLARLKELLSSA